MNLTKGLRKSEISDFHIFAKFKTQNFLYIPYILNILGQYQILIFAKYLFRLEFRFKNLISSLERRALKLTPCHAFIYCHKLFLPLFLKDVIFICERNKTVLIINIKILYIRDNRMGWSHYYFGWSIEICSQILNIFLSLYYV